MEHEHDCDINYSWSSWNCFLILEKRLDELEIRKSETIQTAAVPKSTWKSAGDPRRLAVPRTQVKHHQLELSCKPCKEEIATTTTICMDAN